MPSVNPLFYQTTIFKLSDKKSGFASFFQITNIDFSTNEFAKTIMSFSTG